MVSAKVPCTSSQARTQREQTMHFDGSKVKYGLDSSLSCLSVVLALIAVAHVAQADGARHVLQLAIAVGGAGQAIERMVGDVELHHALAELLQPLGLGRTTMPGATGVVQEAGVPARPSISTRQRRQEPKASTDIGGAELGHLYAGIHGGAHDRGAGRHRDGWPSMVERDRLPSHGCAGVP